MVWKTTPSNQRFDTPPPEGNAKHSSIFVDKTKRQIRSESVFFYLIRLYYISQINVRKTGHL